MRSRRDSSPRSWRGTAVEDNAFTNHDVTAYFQRVAKDRLPTVMAMEADRMANLRLSEEDVTTERKVILEERRSRVDKDPSSILQEQMMAALYTKHPYGIPIIGWAHEMAGLTATMRSTSTSASTLLTMRCSLLPAMSSPTRSRGSPRRPTASCRPMAPSMSGRGHMSPTIRHRCGSSSRTPAPGA